jgi:meso-butanediol dehydrogenase/(S,S)-butanediol dehydrogenase/diacetyl reductase
MVARRPTRERIVTIERRVALVTGGACGIGRACVERFARSGAAVLFTDRAVADGIATARTLAEEGLDVEFVAGDVNDAAHCELAVTTAARRFGRLDMLIANAGVQTGGRLLDSTTEQWRQVLDVNLMGVVHICKAAIPVMLAQAAGSIVIVSSLNALRGFPAMAAYDASKEAVLAVARDIAVEYGGRIRANAVCPGATLTDYHARRAAASGVSLEELRHNTRGYGLVGRVAEPAEIAAVIAFLAGPDASFVTGQVIVADGGYSAIGARS